MKNLIALVAFFLMASSLTAQNALFYSFEMEYEEILERFESNPQVYVQPGSTKDRLIVAHDGGTYTYDFHYGKLYQIESRKAYGNAGVAQKFFESTMDYFDRLRPERLYEEEWDQYEQHVVADRGRLLDLRYDRRGKSELVLTSKYVPHAPQGSMSQHEFLAAYPYERVVEDIQREKQSMARSSFAKFR